jgi:hypothetical protein
MKLRCVFCGERVRVGLLTWLRNKLVVSLPYCAGCAPEVRELLRDMNGRS